MLISLFPAMLSLSFGSTPILDMVPPSKIHGCSVAWGSVDVLVVPNASVDFSQFTVSNSPLWSTAWTQLSVCNADRTDSNASKITPELIFEPHSRICTMATSPDSFNDNLVLNWISCTNFSSGTVTPVTSRWFIPIGDWLTKWPDGRFAWPAPMWRMSETLADALMSLQIIPLYLFFPPLAFTLMHLVLLIPCAGLLALIFDGTLASLGLAIHIAGLCPSGDRRRVSFKPISFCDMIKSITIKEYSSRLIILDLRLMIGIYLISCIPISGAVGLETPKINLHDYFLPGVSRWDGMPYYDFRRVWWLALCAALGNISQDGWSLLQTARNQDLGSPGNPGTAGQAIQSQNRNLRLFGAILNYIEATSYIYSLLSAAPFQNDGRGIFNYLYVYGHLAYTPDTVTRMQNEWTAATMSKCNIAYTPAAVFKWADYVNTLGNKLGKTNNEKRAKYLEGFPSSFDIMVINERKLGNPGSYVYPAVHPAHHPRSGTAHPNAGEPDIDEMARKFFTEWARMINIGQIKPIPHGMHGYNAEQASDDELYDPVYTRDEMRAVRANERIARDEIAHANMTREAVNEHTVCGICGGLGHAGKVDGFGACITLKLGHRIPHEHLSRMQYPDGYNPPRFLHARDSEPKSPRMTRFQRKDRSTPPYSNPRRPHARAIECESDTLSTEPDSSTNDLATASLQVAAEALRLSRLNSKPKPTPRNKRLPARRTLKARIAEENPAEPTEDETENEIVEGEDEHGLSVSFADAEF